MQSIETVSPSILNIGRSLIDVATQASLKNDLSSVNVVEADTQLQDPPSPPENTWMLHYYLNPYDDQHWQWSNPQVWNAYKSSGPSSTFSTHYPCTHPQVPRVWITPYWKSCPPVVLSYLPSCPMAAIYIWSSVLLLMLHFFFNLLWAGSFSYGVLPWPICWILFIFSVHSWVLLDIKEFSTFLILFALSQWLSSTTCIHLIVAFGIWVIPVLSFVQEQMALLQASQISPLAVSWMSLLIWLHSHHQTLLYNRLCCQICPTSSYPTLPVNETTSKEFSSLLYQKPGSVYSSQDRLPGKLFWSLLIIVVQKWLNSVLITDFFISDQIFLI